MNSGKVKCTCGWSWNKSDSSKKDMYICHECGRDNSNNMRNGGWLDNYGEQENYNDYEVSAPEGFEGDGYSNVGRNYSPAWGGQFKNGGKTDPPGKKKKPIYVESEKDPRYKAYKDSLTLYKKTLEIENPKYYIKENGRQSDPSWYNWKGDRLTAEEFGRKNNIDYGYEYYQTGKFPGKIQPIKTGDWGEGMAYPIYKKPEQPVLLQKFQNNLHPEGLVYGNLDINSTLPTIRPTAKNAKSYKVKETVQGKYTPSTVDYQVTDSRNINMNDLGPGNTRVVTPEYAMGGSIPGAVGFTYARTKGIPSNGPYAKKTLASAQDGEQLDMHGNPMLARRVDNPNINRSYYDARLNTMNIGTDYTTWKDDEGNQLTGDDLKYHQDKLLAHENYHAIQHSQDRDNYDIAHNTDNAQWAQMQKRPEVMSTDAVYNNFYNRSDFEDEQDYQEMINSYPESRILNQNLLFDKVLDRQRYDNPSNAEGEAKFYEDTGVDLSKQSPFSLNFTEFQNGGEMSYYQHGLDWKPKGMENGGWLNKYDEAENGKTIPPTNPRAFLRSLKNDTMNKKIADSKGRGRETNITQKDNTRTVTPKVDKPITAKQKEQRQKKAVEQNKEAFIKSNIQANMEDAYESPLMSPGYFTPEGVAIGAMQGMTKLGPDLYEGNYKGAALDVLMALPIAPELGQLSKQGLRGGVDLFHPVGKALAQIEREGAAAGLSAQEIKKLQLEKVGITSAQREGYFPGVSEVFSEYITPYSYDNPVKRVLDIPRRVIKGEKNSKNLVNLNELLLSEGKLSRPRYDAWKMYSGLPQEYNTFRIAETVPVNHPSYSAEQLANLEKFSLNNEAKLLRTLPQDHDFVHLSHGEKQDLVEALPDLKAKLQEIQDLKAKGIDIGNDYMSTNVMGGYNRRYFNDKMEYNDIWDLDLGGTKVDKYFGKPFLSHGQLDYSFKPAEDQLKSLIQRGEYYEKNFNQYLKSPLKEFYLDPKHLNNQYNQLNPKDLIIKKKKQGGTIKAQKGYQTGDKPILGGGKYYTTTGKVVDWGTPEYETAYNRGEVLSDDGVPSEVTLQGGVLPELVLQNNYKRGFWEQYRDKIIDENRDAGPLGAAVGVPISAAFSLPQLAMVKGINNLPTLFEQQSWNDGKMQRPSEAIGFNNDEGAFANPISFGKHASNFLLDAVTDPANLIGAGVLTKENALSKLGKVSTSIAPELRQGVNANGFLDIFKSKKPTTSFAENTTNVSKNLEDLIHAKDWAKQYGYELPENLERIAQSDELTNRTVRGMMNRHNTFVRGVSTNWDEIAQRNPEILRHLEGKGIDWQNNPKAAAEYMSTHVPIQTGYGRAGLNSDVFDQGLDAIYTSNSIPTAEGYTYGQGYITKVKKPTDFSSSNRKDWITQNSPEYYEGALERNKTKYFIGDKDVTGILGNFDSDMNTRRKFMDAQQSKNKMKEFKDNLLKEMEEDLKFYNRNPKFHGGNKEEILRNIEKVKNTDFSKIKINKNEGKKIAHKILKTEKATEEKIFKDFVDDVILNAEKNELIVNDDAARKLAKEIYYKNNELYPSWKTEAEGIKNTKLFRQHFLNDIQNSDSDVLKKILQTYTQKKDYAHYLHLGTPGEQILEPIKSWEITPDIWKNKSRAHTNTYSKKLSAMEEGGIIKDDMGQWAHPGEITEIGSNNITMQGVLYDVLGISDEGDIKLMKPGKNYKFKGKKVTEFPMAKNGVNQQDQKTFEQLDQLTNFTNYNKPQPGGWLNKYN